MLLPPWWLKMFICAYFIKGAWKSFERDRNWAWWERKSVTSTNVIPKWIHICIYVSRIERERETHTRTHTHAYVYQNDGQMAPDGHVCTNKWRFLHANSGEEAHCWSHNACSRWGWPYLPYHNKSLGKWEHFTGEVLLCWRSSIILACEEQFSFLCQVATGDGVAMAHRAHTIISNME